MCQKLRTNKINVHILVLGILDTHVKRAVTHTHTEAILCKVLLQALNGGDAGNALVKILVTGRIHRARVDINDHFVVIVAKNWARNNVTRNIIVQAKRAFTPIVRCIQIKRISVFATALSPPDLHFRTGHSLPEPIHPVKDIHKIFRILAQHRSHKLVGFGRWGENTYVYGISPWISCRSRWISCSSRTESGGYPMR